MFKVHKLTGEDNSDITDACFCPTENQITGCLFDNIHSVWDVSQCVFKESGNPLGKKPIEILL